MCLKVLWYLKTAYETRLMLSHLLHWFHFPLVFETPDSMGGMKSCTPEWPGMQIDAAAAMGRVSELEVVVGCVLWDLANSHQVCLCLNRFTCAFKGVSFWVASAVQLQSISTPHNQLYWALVVEGKAFVCLPLPLQFSQKKKWSCHLFSS